MGRAQLAFAEDRAGIITGSDVSHVTRRGSIRKRPWPEVCAAHARLFSPASSSIILTGSDVRLTSPEGALSGSMFCACLVLFLFSYVVVQNVGWGVLYDVRVLYLAWLPEQTLVICPLLFSYSVYIYIGCVVL